MSSNQQSIRLLHIINPYISKDEVSILNQRLTMATLEIAKLLVDDSVYLRSKMMVDVLAVVARTETETETEIETESKTTIPWISASFKQHFIEAKTIAQCYNETPSTSSTSSTSSNKPCTPPPLGDILSAGLSMTNYTHIVYTNMDM